jgi:hypothetical protein
MSRFSFDDPAVCALQSETTPDPIHAFNVLHSVLEQESSARLALLHPLWPGSYPCVEQPRCFHVTPFHPSFDGARGAIRKACSANGVRYGRGDETGEHHIIRSIWDEIGKAHVVVVDITNLNVNVALELGLADALGRPALIVARDRVGALFPEISHRPVMVYQSSSELHELVRMALLRRN